MPHLPALLAAFDERWPGARRRASGLALALLIEAALFLALLTLGQSAGDKDAAGDALTTIDFAPDVAPEPPRPDPEPQAQQAAEQAPRPSALPRAVPRPRPEPRPEAPALAPAAALPTPAIVPLSRSDMAAADISRMKGVIRSDMQGPMGPPNTGYPGDSQRVGSRPNGEPIYGARWYREPTDQEMRGYLSTASGPGWALITCRTAPDFRVEDCEFVDEHPSGVQIGRAAIAAAWQFKVRPPQVGGQPLVGEWVRIRITYGIRRN